MSNSTGLQQTVYMDYPLEVAIETFTKCNANCSFCPYSTLERIGQRMSDELINKIIHDLQDIPDDVRFFISPFKVNEPFLDNRLLEIVATCNEKLPNAKIRIFSNGSPLTEKKLRGLSDLKRIKHLWISLNHTEPDLYEEIMQIPLERTLDRLDMAHRLKASGDFRYKVIISRVCDSSPSDQEFATWVENRYPLFECVLVRQSHWLGDVKNPSIHEDVPKSDCGRWYEMSITSTGVVALCCMDGKAAYPIGNVTEQHVLDVYNDPSFRRMRENHLDRTAYTPCNSCNL